MSEESDLARALAGALGPLYRVSIVHSDGTVEATFRAPQDEESGPPSSSVPIPGRPPA